MALRITDKPLTVAPGGNYQYGKIKDDTGAGDGTPVNDLVYGDFHQFFARLLAYGSTAGGFSINGQPDNDANGYQLFQAFCAMVCDGILDYSGAGILNVSGKWKDVTDAPGTQFTTVGGGTWTVQVGDVLYNRYKIIGKTLIWQISLRSTTVSSAPSILKIFLPTDVYGTYSTTFKFDSAVQICGVEQGVNILIAQFKGASLHHMELTLQGGGAFTNGTNTRNFDITIVTELA
jgi:hypothetical protein